LELECEIINSFVSEKYNNRCFSFIRNFNSYFIFYFTIGRRKKGNLPEILMRSSVSIGISFLYQVTRGVGYPLTLQRMFIILPSEKLTCGADTLTRTGAVL
jgi:hypothetical protein